MFKWFTGLYKRTVDQWEWVSVESVSCSLSCHPSNELTTDYMVAHAHAYHSICSTLYRIIHYCCCEERDEKQYANKTMINNRLCIVYPRLRVSIKSIDTSNLWSKVCDREWFVLHSQSAYPHANPWLPHQMMNTIGYSLEGLDVR